MKLCHMKFVSVDTRVLSGGKFEKQLYWYDIHTTFPKNVLLASENKTNLLMCCIRLFMYLFI
jgi:hypothetical protein